VPLDTLGVLVARIVDPGDAADAVLARMLAGSRAGVAVFDTELRYMYVNPALARMNGLRAEEHTGRTIAEVLPGLDARDDVMRQVVRDGVAREATSSGHIGNDPNGRRWWHGAYHRVDDAEGRAVGVVAVLLDVTDSWRTHIALDAARHRLSLLDSAAARIGTTLDLDATCSELAEMLVSELADVATVDVHPPDGASGRPRAPEGSVRLWRAAMGARPGMRSRLLELRQPGRYVDFTSGAAVPRCMETGLPVTINRPDPSDMARYVGDAEIVRALRDVDLHSALVVPLLARGDAIGAVTLARSGRSLPFGDAERVLAKDLVDRAATSIDNARRYTHEHDIAMELQRALLADPPVPHTDIEIVSRYRAAGSTAVIGGDWYDAVALAGGRTLLTVGDVMGHGVQAASEMSQFRGLLRIMARSEMAPHEILAEVDRVSTLAGIERVATCLIVIVDPIAGVCEFASAGHLPPLLVGPGQTAELVDLPYGPPLGTGFGGYESVRRPNDPERVLIAYTDGLIERRDEDIDVSMHRLLTVGLSADAPLEESVDRLIVELVGDRQDDDIAVLAVRQRRTT